MAGLLTWRSPHLAVAQLASRGRACQAPIARCRYNGLISVDHVIPMTYLTRATSMSYTSVACSGKLAQATVYARDAAWDASPAPDMTPVRPAASSSRHHSDACPMTTGHPPPDRKGDRQIAEETGPAHRGLDRLSVRLTRQPQTTHRIRHQPTRSSPGARPEPTGGWLRAAKEG